MENNSQPRFHVLDVVSLVRDDPAHKVKREYTGTIVDILNDGEAYTIEFIDEEGNTVEDALLTEYKRCDIKKV